MADNRQLLLPCLTYWQGKIGDCHGAFLTLGTYDIIGMSCYPVVIYQSKMIKRGISIRLTRKKNFEIFNSLIQILQDGTSLLFFYKHINISNTIVYRDSARYHLNAHPAFLAVE